MRSFFLIPTAAEIETRKRIKLAIYAYAYEFENHSVVSDSHFDDLAKSVDTRVSTSRPDLDNWWASNFNPSTGQWIHKHPELDKVKGLYRAYFNQRV